MNEQEGQQGFNLNARIASNELQRRKLLGENIGLLKEMKDYGLFKAVLGDEQAEWVAYLGQIEVFYSRNEVYNLMRIYDKFVDDLGYEFDSICDVPVSRLVELLSVVDRHNVEDLLENARILTSRDFNDIVRSIKGLPTTDSEHEHDYKKLEQCRICGERHEIKESIL